jgi:hypothetical protein
MNKEFLHMQKLAGIITESEYAAKLNENESNESLFSNIWSQLGEGYEYNDGMYETPQGFVFSYDSEENALKAEIQYEDYGDDRDEGESVIDPLLDELRDDLDNKGIESEIKILATSYAYFVTIYFK